MAHRNIVGEKTGHRGDFFLVRDTAASRCYIPCTSKFRLPEIDLETPQASSRLMQVASGYGAYPPVLACGVEDTLPERECGAHRKRSKNSNGSERIRVVPPGKRKLVRGQGHLLQQRRRHCAYSGVRGKFGGWTLAVLVLCLWLNKGNAAKGRAPQATRNALLHWPVPGHC